MFSPVGFRINNVKPTKNIITKNKVLLIIANTYIGTDLELGVPVINDTNIISEKYFSRNYQVLTLIDANLKVVVDWLKLFKDIEFKDFVIYYSGHGTLVENFNGRIKIGNSFYELHEDEEETGKDSAYVFYDYENKSVEFLIDDIFTNIINNFKSDVFIISDCCHSGTIVDNSVELCSHTKSYISACKDYQYAIQNTVNGLFTSFICKNFDTEIKDLIENFNKLSSNQQANYKSNRVKLYV